MILTEIAYTVPMIRFHVKRKIDEYVACETNAVRFTLCSKHQSSCLFAGWVNEMTVT